MSTRELVDNFSASCSGGTAHESASHSNEDAVVHDPNHDPINGVARIGDLGIRAQWGRSTCSVGAFPGVDKHAAGEWSMHGTTAGEPFVVRGCAHYDSRDGKVARLGQCWQFDLTRASIALGRHPGRGDTRLSASGVAVDAP